MTVDLEYKLAEITRDASRKEQSRRRAEENMDLPEILGTDWKDQSRCR